MAEIARCSRRTRRKPDGLRNGGDRRKIRARRCARSGPLRERVQPVHAHRAPYPADYPSPEPDLRRVPTGGPQSTEVPAFTLPISVLSRKKGAPLATGCRERSKVLKGRKANIRGGQARGAAGTGRRHSTPSWARCARPPAGNGPGGNGLLEGNQKAVSQNRHRRNRQI